MSGSIAYVFDVDGSFRDCCNTEMVLLEALDDPDEVIQVKSWIQQHVEHTGSALARDIIAQWGSAVRRFVKVLPIEYKRYLMQQKEVRNHG